MKADPLPEGDPRRLVDPQLLSFLEQYPRYDLTDELLTQIRAGLLERKGAARTSTDHPHIQCHEHRIPGGDGDPEALVSQQYVADRGRALARALAANS